MFEGFWGNFGYVLGKYALMLLKGLGNTMIIAISSFFIGIVIGVIIAAVKVMPKKNNIVLIVLEKIGDFYVGVVRGTPVVVQLLLLYFAILAPLRIPALAVAIIAFGLNSGAYVAEIMRSGIMSIEKGQMEAGRSLGLSYSMTMIKIILPQAIKNTIPTLLNEFIALLKETSVAGYITVIDVTMATQRIVAKEYQALAPYMILAAIYLIVVTILTLIVKQLEKRLRRSDRS